MNLSAPLFRTLLFCLLLAGWSACREGLVIDNNDQDFPVALHHEVTSETVHFSWEAANISTFETYTIVRSASPIPAGLTPNSGGNAQIIFQSDRPDSLDFTDDSPLLSENVYYKLYVDIGNRFVESEAVHVTFDNFLLPGNPTIIKYLPDSNWIIIGNDFSGSVQLIDYVHRTVLATRQSMPFTNLENMAVTVDARPGVAPTLCWWSGYTNPFVLDLATLTLQKTYLISQPPYAWLVDKTGNFITTQYDYNNGLTTRSNADFSIRQGYYRSNYYDRRTLVMLDPDQNLVLEASPYLLRLLTINPLTGIATDGLQLNTNFSSGFLQDIPVTHDGQFFIPQLDGRVYDQDLNLVTQLLPTGNSFLDFAFSFDGQYVYTLAFDQFTFGSQVQKFRFPSLELVGQRRLIGVQPRDIESTPDGGLVFIGSNVNGNSNMLIKKMDF